MRREARVAACGTPQRSTLTCPRPWRPRSGDLPPDPPHLTPLHRCSGPLSGNPAQCHSTTQLISILSFPLGLSGPHLLPCFWLPALLSYFQPTERRRPRHAARSCPQSTPPSPTHWGMAGLQRHRGRQVPCWCAGLPETSTRSQLV